MQRTSVIELHPPVPFIPPTTLQYMVDHNQIRNIWCIYDEGGNQELPYIPNHLWTSITSNVSFDFGLDHNQTWHIVDDQHMIKQDKFWVILIVIIEE